MVTVENFEISFPVGKTGFLAFRRYRRKCRRLLNAVKVLFWQETPKENDLAYAKNGGSGLRAVWALDFRRQMVDIDWS